MNIYDVENMPYAEFGSSIKRKVRLVISPDTTGEEGVAIVQVNIPPGGISEGHLHRDCDEYILFDNEGAVILDGLRTAVNKGSLIHAVKGVMHECINTSENKDLNLTCVFVPPFKPYGSYPDLIKRTKDFLKDTGTNV
jgi:quercetin dioxygenase-like cupin family protein